MLRASGFDGVAENEAEKVGAKDSQNATYYGADQTFEADDPQARLKEHYSEADNRSGSRCLPALERKRAQHEAGDRHNENEDRSYK